MAWIKKPNVAMYKGANWDNFIKTVPNCSPEQAKRIAMQDSNITFFFFCNQTIVLEGRGTFNAGDAVFFSGEPHYGDAPQCDSYQKDKMTIVYIDPKSSEQFKDIASYKLADGSPAIDVVCIFAANYASSELPYFRAYNNNPPTTKPFNDNIQQVFDDDSVKFLQDKGITVLLTVLNGHSQVGWSEFTSQSDAQNFVNYLKEIVDKYGLDGIDIDDEYSSGTPQTSSLVMVTTLMKQSMPDKIISKALWSDIEYFSATFEGKTLAENLTYGWEMSYGGSPTYRLPPYVSVGMNKNQLSLGFWSGQPSRNVSGDVNWIKTNGYEGVMVYAFQDQPNVDLMGELVNDLYGTGNWNKD